MDQILDKLSSIIPLAKLFQKLGINQQLSNLLSLITVTCIVYLIIKFVTKSSRHYIKCKSAKDLAPYFDKNKVSSSVKYYIPTKGQNITPSHEDEPGYSSMFVVRTKLINWFINDVFNEEKSSDKFHLILADSGMGKSTFMINLYIKYNSFFNLRKKYEMVLIPFGDERILEKIKTISQDQDKTKNTILLLDAFDEYKGIFQPDQPDELNEEDRFKKTLDELFEIVRDFRYVIITSRTQYFPGQEDQPYELKIPRFDDNGFHRLSKIYISPFNQSEIDAYLNKKYGKFNPFTRRKKKSAISIIKDSNKLMVRPMLLSYINYLVDDKQKYRTTFDIYNTLINQWIEREANKRRFDNINRTIFKNDLFKFSQLISLEIYKNRKHSLNVNREIAEKICRENDINLNGYEITGQSLLTKDVTSNWKFAHKSIYEFYIAKHAIEDFKFGFFLDITSMDMTKHFMRDYKNGNVYLFNFSHINSIAIPIRLDRTHDHSIKNTAFESNQSNTFICKELIRMSDIFRFEHAYNDNVNILIKSYLNTISHTTSYEIPKTIAIQYINILNEFLGHNVKYNMSGVLVGNYGKPIKDISNFQGFRLPTLLELTRYYSESDGYIYTNMMGNNTPSVHNLKSIPSEKIPNIEWTHETIQQPHYFANKNDIACIRPSKSNEIYLAFRVVYQGK